MIKGAIMVWIILLVLVIVGLLFYGWLFFSREKKLSERFFREISNDTAFFRLLNMAKEENITVDPQSRILGGEEMMAFLTPPKQIWIMGKLIKNYLEKKSSVSIETVRFIFAHELGHFRIKSAQDRLKKECSFFRNTSTPCLFVELLACQQALVMLGAIEGKESLPNYQNSWILWVSPALYKKQCRDCFKKVTITKFCPKADEVKTMGAKIEEMLGL